MINLPSNQLYKSWKGSNNVSNIIVSNNKRPVNSSVNTSGKSRSNIIFGPSQKATTSPATTNTRNSRLNKSNNFLVSGVGPRERVFGTTTFKTLAFTINK